MDKDFWIKKWKTPKPGFQQEKVNSRLKKHWHRLGLTGGKIFVPLCGSTIDMRWLIESGFQVFGVEFSEVACRKYFESNNLDYEEITDSRFNYFKGENIELWQGDFFALESVDLVGVRGVYDRASLIALPENMRNDYSDHLSNLLETDSQIFLISMDYDESKMNGPPFSVGEEEINNMLGRNFDIELVAQSSGPDIVGSLAQRGLDTLNEKVYLLKKR